MERALRGMRCHASIGAARLFRNLGVQVKRRQDVDHPRNVSPGRYLLGYRGERSNSLPTRPQSEETNPMPVIQVSRRSAGSCDIARSAPEIAASRSSPADRPAVMAVSHRAIERCPWTQRLLGDAGDDCISILDELLIDDPCP